jgi:alpha-L-rhamnosidase
MLELGLTTWAETAEPTRSDDHAWSAHPNYDLLTLVAGIRPASPGFRTVLIAPHLGTLTPSAPGCPTPRATSSSATAGPATDGTSRSTLPRGCLGEPPLGRPQPPLAEGSNRLAY